MLFKTGGRVLILAILNNLTRIYKRHADGTNSSVIVEVMEFGLMSHLKAGTSHHS